MKSIFCLFSIDNNYDQPENNLVAWWSQKPNLITLAKVLGVNVEGEGNNIKFTESTNIDAVTSLMLIHQGNHRINGQRIGGTDYRLQEVKEGEIL